MVKATNISKSYKEKVILKNITFSLAKGDAAVIVGRNGAGKSTFLFILANFLKADSGLVALDSTSLGFVPQEDSLFLDLTVADNYKFWQAASKKVQTALINNTPNFLEIFKVDEYLQKKVKDLSGGMKKSVAICCQAAHNPDILILDEPFSGLDIYYKNMLISALIALKEQGKTIIYTSHNIDEITPINSNVYTLHQGELSLIGTSDIFKNNSDYFAKLLENLK